MAELSLSDFTERIWGIWFYIKTVRHTIKQDKHLQSDNSIRRWYYFNFVRKTQKRNSVFTAYDVI